ncbi:MAG TPA: hypothetical protein VEL31_00860 [Ktedonobacteraceae bacterium]|nr:hypothetical protein [Ktedonobacteraceae bacterium]
MSPRAIRYTWEDLTGHLAPEVLHAPKTGGDPNGAWPIVHERIAGYIGRNMLGAPWVNQVALIAAVLSARRRDVQTVSLIVRALHDRFRELFPALELKGISDWKPDLHLPPYLKGAIIQDTHVGATPPRMKKSRRLRGDTSSKIVTALGPRASSKTD